MAAPAGWYDAPGAGEKLRYWDGYRWTEQFADKAIAAGTSTAAGAPIPTQWSDQPKNTPALLGMIFGIVSVFLFFLWLPGPAAIVLSSVGLSRASALARAGHRAVGKGQAITGLVLGIIYTIAPVLQLIVMYRGY